MSRHLARATALLLSFAAVTALHAQDTGALSLEDCIARAMKKNFDLTIQGYSTDISREALNVSRGAFDPTLNASVTRSLSQAASTINTLDGTTGVGQRNDGTNSSISVNQFVPQTGGTVTVSTAANRNATNSRFSTLNPSFGNNVAASVSQPLLKNAGSTVARATYERSKIGLSIANLNYKTRVLTVVRDTESAYYNLVSARETQRIRQLSLELAQKLFDENQAKRTTGVMTDLDVLSAEVGVANARRAVIQAEQTVHDREDTLLNLIGPSDFSRPGGVAFGDYREGAPSFGTSYKLARDNSPDYLSTQATIRQLELDLATSRQNRLPTLNLNGSLAYTNTDSSYSDVYGNLIDRHGNNWSLGLTYSMPWGQRADKARLRSSEASLNQQRVRLSQFEQTLIVSVRAAVRAVETNLVSVEIAAKATQLSEKQYELQKARFDAGLSTSRLVLQAQDDLESARLNELTSKVALRTAIAELHRLEGSSITRFKIDLPE